MSLCVTASGARRRTPSRQPASDDKARQVALSVQAFYDQTKSVEAEFHQTYYNRVYDRTTARTGR